MYQVYSLVFLVAHCHGRRDYPGDGWSADAQFTDTDLEVTLIMHELIHHVISTRWLWSTWPSS